MSLPILEELAHELVHQQFAWSESLILPEDASLTLANANCKHLGSLLEEVHCWLSTTRSAETYVVVVELMSRVSAILAMVPPSRSSLRSSSP